MTRKRIDSAELTEGDVARFFAKVRKTEGCWLWMASAVGERKQYGQFGLGRSKVKAHRLSYALAHGVVPEGSHLHHTCRNGLCVNPAHLELLAADEAHPDGTPADKAAMTHCHAGHAYTQANTYIRTTGQRRCRECDRAAARMRRA